MGLLARLFGSDRERRAQHANARLDEMVERAIAMNPRMQLALRYRERLVKAMFASNRYIDELVDGLPPPHEANAAAWATDPWIRAFFATPDDLAIAFSRSEALRTYFEGDAGLTHAYATLGMAMTERHVLGVALEGEMVRHDVPQTKLCFSDHRVRICARTDAELRLEIKRRLVDQLALEGLARLAIERRELIAHGEELLDARVALLERQGAGMRAVVGYHEDVNPNELAQIQLRIDENAHQLAALSVPTELIELEFERVCDVFAHPEKHLHVEKRCLRVDFLNVIRNDDAQASREIEFRLARVPGDPPETRAFALVRFPRAELLPAGLNFDAVARAL